MKYALLIFALLLSYQSFAQGFDANDLDSAARSAKGESIMFQRSVDDEEEEALRYQT